MKAIEMLLLTFSGTREREEERAGGRRKEKWKKGCIIRIGFHHREWGESWASKV